MLDSRFDQEAQPPPAMRGPRPVPRAYAGEMLDTRAKYLRDWRIVKAARFNAAKRIERKQAASLLAFALAGTAGFVVPFFTLLFAERLAPHTKNVLDFASYVSGALSLSIGLVEQAKNYPALAHRFHRCGLAVNSVRRRLRNLPTPDTRELDALSAEYERALHECEANHDDIDQAIAVATQTIQDLERATETGQRGQIGERQIRAARRRMARLRTLEVVQIYWLYTLVWLGPAVLALVVWFALAPSPAAS